MDTGPRSPTLVFPADFVWGVATSSHQVEGGNSNNQWAAWEQRGRIKSRDRVGFACDWWRNAEQDFDLGKSLGVNALRLSVEWSRIEPHEGQWDESALARYRQMLKALHERGIRPFVTLHHFTNPQWFEAKGAFANPESVRLFQRFTQRVMGALGDLCRDWSTFNEPNVYVSLGYFLGEFPPGKKGRVLESARVTRNLCLAHAAAYRTIHSLQKDANVGWAQHYVVFKPRRTESAMDRWLCSFIQRRFNDNFAEGIQSGQAPFPLNKFGQTLPDIKGTCDFVGINYYSRLRVGFELRSPRTLFVQISVPPHKPREIPALKFLMVRFTPRAYGRQSSTLPDSRNRFTFLKTEYLTARTAFAHGQSSPSLAKCTVCWRRESI
jgi:beta-glucosidase